MKQLLYHPAPRALTGFLLIRLTPDGRQTRMSGDRGEYKRDLEISILRPCAYTSCNMPQRPRADLSNRAYSKNFPDVFSNPLVRRIYVQGSFPPHTRITEPASQGVLGHHASLLTPLSSHLRRRTHTTDHVPHLRQKGVSVT